MRYKLLRVIATMAVAFSFLTLAHGHSRPPHNPKTCHDNPRLCLTQMKLQISQLRAYVTRVKPGDPVTFSLSTGQSGAPNANYRRALQAYRSLQEEISDFSRIPPGPCKSVECRAAISDVQTKFDRIGQATDRNSADMALAAMKPCIEQLSRVLLVPHLDQSRATRR